ncbi:MAG: DHA2 family efflux MFS transporter permease subunit [Gammaproteobacteria bacterium]|jgi:DHA2 family multidrug resistance protein
MNVPRATNDVHPVMITVTVMLATIMQVIDTTIANVALPHMQGSLSATQDQVSWVLTSYIVASAIMTPPTGWLSGRFGRRRVFVAGIVGFTVASFLCGVSTSLDEIVLFRILQGVCGAALVPLSQAILLDTYPREKHGVAMAMWGIGIMIGPILGPTLGGYLTEWYSWRWVFFINVPVGIVAAMMTLSFVPETDQNRARSFDWFGFLILSLGIGALQMLLDRGQGEDWFASTEIIVETIIAALGFYVFLIHATLKEHPFIDLKMLKDRNFATGLTLMFVFGIVLLATMSLIPPFLQNLIDFPVVTTGLVLAPRGVGAMLSMMVVSRLIQKVDPRIPVTIGMLIVSFALYEMSKFTLQVDTWTVVWTGFVQGLGLGQLFVPLSTIAFSTLPAEQRTEASGVFNLIRNIGSSVGISIVFTMLTRNTQVNHATLAEYITPYTQQLHHSPLAHVAGPHSALGAAMLNGLVTRQAAMIAFADDFRLMMYIALSAVPLMLILRNNRKRPVEAERPADRETEEREMAAYAAD